MDPIQNALQTQQSSQAATPQGPMAQNQALFKKILSSNRQLIEEPQQNQQSGIAQAMGILSPQSTKEPLAQIGKAIATPNYAGYCLQWVDDQTGNSNRLPNAYADYQAKAQSGNIQTGTDNIPKGARVYFAPDSSNGGMGHVGLSNGDGTFTSATDNGIKTFDIPDWEKYTGQKYLGYASS